MPRQIQDEFTDRPGLSRQRRYQLRHRAAGLCEYCGAAAVTRRACELHRQLINRRQRQTRTPRA